MEIKIQEVKAREIIDSRGIPTLEACVTLEGGHKGTASVPSGASTGEYEACELRDQNPERFLGKGVLKAMKKLFNVTDSVFPLADKLGSDSTYLLKGGYARLLKRGEEVIPINCNKTLYFVVIYANAGVETKLCFNEFDRLNKSGIACDIKEVINAVRNGDFSVFKDKNNNALYDSARNLNGEIEENLNALKSLSPNYCGMTGSGSTVFCMYEELEMAKWACDKLKKQNKNAELLTTFNPLKPTLIDIILKRDYAFKE